jgi:hypothetical protein
LVFYSYFEAGGSSSSAGWARLFRLSGDRLESFQWIYWETHRAGLGPAMKFDAKTSTLTIRADHYMPGDAHCCISANDIVTFHWNGKSLVQVSLRTEKAR